MQLRVEIKTQFFLWVIEIDGREFESGSVSGSLWSFKEPEWSFEDALNGNSQKQKTHTRVGT